MHVSDRDESFYRSQSYWLDSVPGSLAPRPRLTGTQQADVVIVGAGYTGLWTAWYLREHAPHLDIVLLDADIAGFGASGRNGGWCTAYLSGLDQWLDQPATRAAALTLQRDLMAAVDEVGRVSCLEAIDCHFDKRGHVAVAVTREQLRRSDEDVAWWHALGFGEEHVRALNVAEVRQHVRMADSCGGHFMRHCAALHPARLARGLARSVVAKGVRLYEQSPVLALSDHGVRTPEGEVQAAVTLLATEGFTNTIEGLQQHLIPVHSVMLATEPLTPAERAATGLERRHTWNSGSHLANYGQLTFDGRIAFGNRGRYGWGSRIETTFADSDPLFAEAQLALGTLFPALKDKTISHFWGGPMGVPRNLQPAVVFDAVAGHGWAGGYFGDGVAASNLAGRTLADLVLKRDTERSRALWVNPPGLSALPQRAWEPEPLRWLAISARYRIMGWADAAEAAGRPSARRWNQMLERFPG